MGGKSDDSGSNDQQMSNFRQEQMLAQQAASQVKQKEAADEPVKEPKKGEQVTEAPMQQKPAEEVVPGAENLTGLGDELVGGLSPGREQQVKDQQGRLTSTPQDYGVGFDPYTGRYAGQGPYTGGQV
jgi:hypothetical protein